MISVPNRQRPLNGNNIWRTIVLLSIVLFFAACATTNTTTREPKVIEPNKDSTSKVDKEVLIEVDTVAWTFKPVDEAPPITNESKVEAYSLERVEKDYYRIALLLPFQIKQDIPNIDKINKKFADFYAGIKMAAGLEDRLNAQIKVYYTNRPSSRGKDLVTKQSEMSQVDNIIQQFRSQPPDIIIGSYQNEVLSKLAAYAEEYRVPLISPWKASTRITSENPFYLQMRPGIDSYYETIVNHVQQNYKPEDVFIIEKENSRDAAKTKILLKIHHELFDSTKTGTFQVANIALDSLMDAEANVFDTILMKGAKAFILPHYSSTTDEAFVYSCLRKMYGEKGYHIFHVYTLPVALNSERVDVNILKNLNIRTAEFRFPNNQDKKVQSFREAFQKRYGWLPTSDAYYGFDLMRFINFGLKNHGQYFHYFMADEPLDLMQMKVHISPYFKGEREGRLMPDMMVNKHLYIIEYDRDHFVIDGQE